MTEYEIDVAARQIVHWLRDELARKPPRVTVSASREYVANDKTDFGAEGLGPDVDAASQATIGTLEARPADRDDGWVLQIRVEDIVGPHVPEDESAPDSAEDIDFEGFCTDFIVPDRGTISVTVSTETPAAKRHFDRLFADLIRDRHRA